MIVILWLGLYPQPVIDTVQASLGRIRGPVGSVTRLQQRTAVPLGEPDTPIRGKIQTSQKRDMRGYK